VQAAKEAEAGHFAQLHGPEDRVLIREVSDYLARGLESGGVAIAIATCERRKALLAALSEQIDTERSIGEGALQFMDAEQTLDRFVVRGYPDAERFDAVVGERVRDAWARSSDVRAYGEMVGVLWKTGRFPAAIRLEQLWNALRREVPFALYCAYPIDVFGNGFDAVAADALLRAHTQFLPAEAGGSLERAVARAAKELLGSNFDGFERHLLAQRSGKHAALPAGESMVLWLKTSHADRAGEVLERARKYYCEGCA
jgi:hypothetical protein